MKTREKKPDCGGFTLLELLLALTVMVMVSLGVAAGLSAAIRAWERGEKNLVQYQRKRIVCRRLIQDIGSAINIRGKPEDESRLKMIFDGVSDSLSFISTSAAMTSPGMPMALKEIHIGVVPGEGLVVREAMFSRSDFFNHDKGIAYVLDPNIESIKFRYYYLPRPSRLNPDLVMEGEWVDEWGPDHVEISEVTEEDDEGSRLKYREFKLNLPLAVEVTLTERDPETDRQIVWAPVVIPLKEGRSVWVSTKRRR